MKYVVEITETLAKHVVVEANSIEEAVDKAESAYDAEKIVLDYGNYEGVDFECLREADEDDVQDYINVEDL